MYNTFYHTSLRCSPFEALYGYSPPQLGLGTPPSSSSSESIDQFLKEIHGKISENHKKE
jgi:hypothetical protein